MSEKLGLIEPDGALRRQLLGELGDAGFHAEPFGGLREFLQFRKQGDYAVLVNDGRVDVLSVRESLCREGDWLAVIGYCPAPNLRRIVAVMRGGGYDYFALPLDTATLARSLSQLRQAKSPFAAARQRAAQARIKLAALSPREAEVLANMAEGRSNKTIGIDLGISPRTVEIHRANMLSKLGVHSSTEALRMYYEHALLEGEAAVPGE
ncbi:LuxR C-terminal-related transcriptional regulator [Citromicrobium bathyomarinum]|jgi:FixJ family two-component response regulator|uniref:response regulator transcription factor n=1 Tax=Sphingomonadales TaxID=204457 RepID=UPI000C5851FA|nr:helix-turn-helix transcriptional regulator [Citromicrobium sp.]MBO80369.1 helix-turn-helix transcriptional regulator [Citromicrobium sp.]|tara:strand:+ start:34495 stop:35118 length:624 start_codon:yes stop_codon:yes gene_type:complete